MSPGQQSRAMQLVATGLSKPGYVTATTIVGLENVLDHVENWQVDWGRQRGRDPQLYWLRVFGEPDLHGAWSWRFGGHHVSVQHLVLDGEVGASSPCFLGWFRAAQCVPDNEPDHQERHDGQEGAVAGQRPQRRRGDSEHRDRRYRHQHHGQHGGGPCHPLGNARRYRPDRYAARQRSQHRCGNNQCDPGGRHLNGSAVHHADQVCGQRYGRNRQHGQQHHQAHRVRHVTAGARPPRGQPWRQWRNR
jgi:hypothetical protein